MSRQVNYRALSFFVLALGAMVILASGISKILFAPEIFALNTPAEEQPVAALGKLRFLGNDLFFYVFFFLLTLAIISLMLFPEGRNRLMRFILLIAVLYLLSQLIHPRLPDQNLLAVTTETVKPIDSNELQPVITPSPDLSSGLQVPSWLVTVVGIGLALLIVSGIAAIFWFIGQQRHSASTSEIIIQEARTAVEALETGGDFQDVILRCYARMSQVLSEQRSVYRESAMTPHEFECLLIKLGFPPEPVRTITRLFEEVRYGSIPQGENGMLMAVSSLNAIILYCSS